LIDMRSGTHTIRDADSTLVFSSIRDIST
jgi:hypothetical protein